MPCATTCLLDSLATLEIPSLGYGIRYEFGIFEQGIVDGWQVEKTDKWLRYGNPWEIVRPEWAIEVMLGGHTEQYRDLHGRPRSGWIPARTVLGIPYETPILGYRTNTANTLRLWRAAAPESFDFAQFNREAIGEYWIKDPDRLRDLEPLADDPTFGARWRAVKRANKQHFACPSSTWPEPASSPPTAASGSTHGTSGRPSRCPSICWSRKATGTVSSSRSGPTLMRAAASLPAISQFLPLVRDPRPFR